VNEFFNIAPSALALLCAFAVIAGTARGFSGFGGALIFMPLASTVISPMVAAPLHLVFDAVMTFPLIPKAFHEANRGRVYVMVAGTAIGAPIGAWLLVHSDPDTARWGISIIILCMLSVLMSGWRYHGTPHHGITAAFGVLSGFVSGLSQMGGPPVVAYWLGTETQLGRIRASILLTFALSTIFQAISYFVGGILIQKAILAGLIVGPAYGLGLYAGNHMFGMASELAFRRICYALIIGAAIIGLPIWKTLL
jgi:uncharacterized membrane protein YfcA